MNFSQAAFHIHTAEIALSGSATRQSRQSRVKSSATTHRSHESTPPANGEVDDQRVPSKRLSIRKLGSVFGHDKRARSSFGGSSNGRSSQLTAVQSSNGDNEDADDPIEDGRKSVDIENFGRANRRAGLTRRESIGSQGKALLLAQATSINITAGRALVQRGQPVGFDFEDFDTIDESPERIAANTTPRRHDTKRSGTNDRHADHITANDTQHEYKEAETERNHANGSALGNGSHRHHQQQEQALGLDTEGIVNSYTENTAADASQYDCQQANTEEYYEDGAHDLQDTTPSGDYTFLQRKESLRANTRLLGNGYHNHQQSSTSTHINGPSSTDGYHHQHSDESFHKNGNTPSNCYHHQDTESLQSNRTDFGNDYQYRRGNESIDLTYTETDIARMAEEVKSETIADVNLSLFVYYILKSDENYELAKKYVRELGLDAVSPKSSVCYHSSHDLPRQ
jgi:hypothetical protein